jgi:hypothetical protein
MRPLLLTVVAAVIIAVACSGGLAQSAGAPGWLTSTAILQEKLAATSQANGATDDSQGYLAPDTNTGEDFTRPVNRFDVRYKYEQTRGSVDTQTLTLRLDSRFDLPSHWELSTRVDLPIVRDNLPAGDDPEGNYEAGLGNVLTQALLITPHVNRMAAGGGMRVIWPTVTSPQLGNQKYVLGPEAGAAWYPTFMRDGSLIGLLTRYEFSVGGGSGSPIDQLIVQPVVNVNLPNEWFANFQPELTMNCNQNSRWFIPFDVTVGKIFAKNTVISLEYKQGLLKDFDLYDWSLELQIGFFF